MDIDILLWFQNIRNTLGEPVSFIFNIISYISYASAAAALYLYWCKDKRKGLFTFVCLLLANLVLQTIKNICCIYRPWIRDSRIQPYEKAVGKATGYSFPSGHTGTAASAWGAAAYAYKEKKKIVISLIVLIVLIGISRCYLGVHTPQDVLVGGLIGAAAVYAGRRIMQSYEGKEHLSFKMMCILSAGIAALTAFTVLKTYPVDYVNGELLVDPVVMQKDAILIQGAGIGFVIGLYLENRYIRFDTEQLCTKQIIVRLIVGLVVTGGLFLCCDMLGRLFFTARTVSFIKGAAGGFGVVYLAPAVFVKIEQKAFTKKGTGI